MFQISTEHKHSYDITGAKEIKAPLKGGRHTSFMLIECKCGDKMCFPTVNYKLAIEQGTDKTLELLKSLGV